MTDHVRFLQIEPTTRCNFACRFCVGRRLPQQDMPLEVFEALLRLLPGLRHIELQGEGEPLLHPQFFEMVRRTRHLHPVVRISTITNGSLLAPKNIRQIVDLGFHKLYVSIESARPEVFWELRRGRLETVLEGIRALLEARRAGGSERPAIGLAVTVLRRTVAEVPDLLRLYEALGIDGGVMLQPLQAMGNYSRHYDSEIRGQLLSAEDAEGFNQLLAREPHLLAILCRPVKATGFYQELYAASQDDAGACPWLAQGLYVSADGRMASCCFQKDAEVNNFGRVGEVTANDMLHKRRELAEGLRHGRPPPGCHGCPVAKKILLPVGQPPADPHSYHET
jgi:MoaA/NifB/PqqE/SkfB family radical SAM enzyme